MGRMSQDCRVIYERGKYFIETGTSSTFMNWVVLNTKIVRYTPEFILKRISDFILKDDKESAITLWLLVCQNATLGPKKIVLNILSIIFHVIIAGIAVYSFINILSN